MSEQTRHLTENHILNNLSDADYEQIHSHLEPVKLTWGEIIYHPEQTIEYVYFPSNSMGSIIATTTDGQASEVGVAGREGIIGIDVLMGVDSTSNECIVQIAGAALRIKTHIIREQFNKSESMRKLILPYIHALMMQISQTALCNRLHPIEQRLTRWLLMCQDRSTSDVLPLTQEFLSIMLGSNRPTITQAALTLQGAGLINYSRGKITITDREAIEEFA